MRISLALLVIAGALSGCVTRSAYQLEQSRSTTLSGLLEQRDQQIAALEKQIQELSAQGEKLALERRSLSEERLAQIAQLEALRRENDDLRARIEAQQKRIREREAELAAVGSTYRRLVDQLEGEVASGQVEIERLRGQIKVRASEKVLFGSGKVDLEPAGRDVLRKVAAEIRGLEDQRVRVEGHTDSVPIRTQRYPSNWELSAARAAGVVRFLEAQGIEARRLEAVGLADTAPLASNDTPGGRARNRRIAIVLVPAGG
ncbi:MAG: OmpA family protein [Myxococcota bacterium]